MANLAELISQKTQKDEQWKAEKAAERENAVVGARAVGDDFARLNALTALNDRALILARLAVEPGELAENIDVVFADDDLARVDVGNFARRARADQQARIERDRVF